LSSPPSREGSPCPITASITPAPSPEHAFPGGYANLLEPEATDQIPHVHGDNLPRLQRIKAAVDPDGVFSATPLPMPGPA
jgi:FAD/FMN-containing dehydrogenase